MELLWEDPPRSRWFALMQAFHRRLASFSRLIIFNKRGIGASDRAAGIAELETRMGDVLAVMEAAGSERAALVGGLAAQRQAGGERGGRKGGEDRHEELAHASCSLLVEARKRRR
jgi:hypothetical protein